MLMLQKKWSIPAIISYALSFSCFEHIIIRGIMVKYRPNINITDRIVKFGKDVRFGIIIEKNYWPHVKMKPWRLLNAGAIKGGCNFSHSTKFSTLLQNLKIKRFCWRIFFNTYQSFWINWCYLNCIIFFPQILYFRNQGPDLDQILRYNYEIKKWNDFWMTFFYISHVYRTKTVFYEFWT